MDQSNKSTRRELLLNTIVVGGGVLASRLAQAAEPAANRANLAQVKAEEIGIDPRRLQVAYDLLEKWTAGPNAPVPGAAMIVGRGGKTVAPRYFGRQGPEADAGPLRRDAMFYMASVTKPTATYTSAMMLVERGRLNLSDRVTRYIPEFSAHGKEETLVAHLFTHTSGLPDELPNGTELRKQHAPLKKFIEGSIQATPLFKAGTKQSYSSAATMVVAEIVQRLSGVSIQEFARREIFEPLGLKSTGLGSQGFARERLVHATVPDDQAPEFGWNSEYWQKLGSPAGGMFSTPEDMAVVCALMLGGGKLGDVRLLSPATVRMMTSNRLNDFPDLPEPVRRTQPWGLGWRLNHPGTPGSWGDLLGRHVFGHTGSSGTMVWMDPQTKGFAVFLTNLLRVRAPWRLVHLSNAVAAAFV
jgi:CubicO group peptidase (beta-lactamase class C family)